MSFYRIIASLSVSLCLLSSPISSFAATPESQTCPSIAALQSVPFHWADLFYFGGWAAYNMELNKYDTTSKWAAVAIVGDVADQNEAIAKGNEILQSVSIMHGPEKQGRGSLLCVYMNPDNETGMYAMSEEHSDFKSIVARGLRR